MNKQSYSQFVNNTHTFELKAFNAIWTSQMENANAGIGVIANDGHTGLALKTNLPLARKVLAEMFADDYTGPVTKVYNGLPSNVIKTYTRMAISDSLAKKAVAEMEKIDYDNVNNSVIVRILDDLNAIVDITLQQTIDASKSGDKVVRYFVFHEYARALSLSEASVKVLWNDEDVTNAEAKQVKDEEENAKVINTVRGSAVTTYDTRKERVEDGVVYFADAIHLAKKQSVEELVKFANAARNHYDKMRFSDKEVGMVTALSKKFLEQFLGFKDLDNLYLGYVSYYINEMQSVFNKKLDDELEQEALLSAIREDHRERVNGLTKMGRFISKNLTPTQRIFLAKHASSKAGGSDLGNGFSLALFGAETYLAAIDTVKDGVKFVGSRMTDTNRLEELAEGDTVEVVKDKVISHNGVAVTSSVGVLDAMEDGTYTVFKHEEAFYAGHEAKKVVDVSAPEEIDELAVALHYAELKGQSLKQTVEVDGRTVIVNEPTKNIQNIMSILNNSEEVFITANPHHGNYLFARVKGEVVRVAKIAIKTPSSKKEGVNAYQSLIDGKKGKFKMSLATDSDRGMRFIIVINNVDEAVMSDLPAQSKKKTKSPSSIKSEVKADGFNEVSEDDIFGDSDVNHEELSAIVEDIENSQEDLASEEDVQQLINGTDSNTDISSDIEEVDINIDLDLLGDDLEIEGYEETDEDSMFE